ncbi:MULTISPECIES: hypothetical protein [unclassified Parabacteroides]|uniref:hypothetical protein n=1 Tax=unclassified Parabacteroides TaxID=2649774 RepID=UPI0024732855|nr:MULTISPECIES: hypothetical protein [unclassified Parabacteroides]
MNYIKTKTDFDMEQPALLNLYEALSDEGFTGKVVIANGTTTLTSVFNISNDKKLTGTLYFGRDFQSGDTITVGICHTYQLANTQFEAIKLCSKTLTEQEVAALSVKSQFVINDTTFPNIDPFGFLPTGYTNVHTVLTAIVVNETDRSHSFMQLADGDDGF